MMGYVVAQLQQAHADMPRLPARFDFTNDRVALAGDVDPRENVTTIRSARFDADVANLNRRHILQKRGKRFRSLLLQVFH